MTHRLIPILSRLRLHHSDASLPVHKKEEAFKSMHRRRLKKMLICNSTMAVSITKKKSGKPALQAFTRARVISLQVVWQVDSPIGIHLNGNINIFKVNLLSLGKMGRRSKLRKTKAMTRLWCQKVLITLRCKIKCINSNKSNNSIPITINNLTSSSSSPKIQTATAKNLTLQDSVVANKLTKLIQRDQLGALFIKAKTVTCLWASQRELE